MLLIVWGYTHRIIDFDKRNVKAHGQLARLYKLIGDDKNALKHKYLMFKWIEYFKDRPGFGPYQQLMDLVLEVFAKTNETNKANKTNNTKQKISKI